MEKSISILFGICFLAGIVFCLSSFLVGDFLGDLLQIQIPFLQPISLFVGLTIFGGAGFLLTNWTSLNLEAVLFYAAGAAFFGVAFYYYLVIRPAKGTESSTGFSLQDLIGKQGEVWITIPDDGHGEVLITMTGGNTNHIAASLDGNSIPEGTKVTVQKVKDQVLFVEKEEG
jgi:membrane protein implicated in regulation of membrane protease activity